MSKNDTELTVVLEDRLDTLTSPELEEKLEEEFDGVEKVIFDFAMLEYISSAGLRVLVGAAQELDDEEGIVIRNVTDPVRDVFEVTGLIEAFVIE